MANFDFLAGDAQGFDVPALPTTEGFTPPVVAPTRMEKLRGGISSALEDPNILNVLASLGGNISQGKSFGEAAGGATREMIRNQAFQRAAAGKSAQQAGIVQQLIDALKGDPTGRNLLGPKEDRSTLDSITMTNDGINIKAPNPDITRPFENLTDQAMENRTGAFETPPLPTMSEAETLSPTTAPRLGEDVEPFPFL